MVQETQTGALYHPRGGDGEGDGTEVQKGGDICIPMADYFLRNKREKKMQRWHERIGHFVYEWLLARNGHPSRDHTAANNS